MSIILFQRPPRRSGPDMPGGDLSLQEPPELSEAQPGGRRGMMPMMLMSAVMMLMFTGNSRGGLTYVMAGMMVVAMGGMVVGQVASSSADRKQKLSGDRRDYMRYLSQTRKRVRHSVTRQRDFLELRIGTGRQRQTRRFDRADADQANRQRWWLVMTSRQRGGVN